MFPQDQRGWAKLAILTGLLLIIFACIWLAGKNSNSPAAEIPSNTATPSLLPPTLPPSPTATIQPTETHTLIPTDTPEAETTETPNLDMTATDDAETAELIDYLLRRELVLETIGEIKGEIDPTFGLYIEGKVDPHNSLWQSTMYELIDAYDEAIDIHRDMIVPPVFAEGHDLTQNGLDNCSIGFSRLMEGAINGNTETYQVGVSHIQFCNERWAAGTQLVMNTWADLGEK
jgi:hypothetical protein